MPAAAVFLDNTVLCNFAAVRRLDLLETVLRGRGRWVEAVALEAACSAGHLPDLHDLHARRWLGPPIEIDAPDEVDRVERIRRAVFGGVRQRALQHLGEAQTYFVLHERSEFREAWWVTDDQEAVRLARRQGVLVCETIDLVKMLVADADLTADAAFHLMMAMDDQGQAPRLPARPSDLLG